MAKSRDVNLWDGFDGREIVYDDKKENEKSFCLVDRNPLTKALSDS